MNNGQLSTDPPALPEPARHTPEAKPMADGRESDPPASHCEALRAGGGQATNKEKGFL